ASGGRARPTAPRGGTPAVGPTSPCRQESVDRSGTQVHRTRQPTSLEVGFPSQTRGEKLEERGTHIICELSGCDARVLTDLGRVRSIMVAAAKEANAEVLKEAF